ncbi:transmembrane protease serine 11D-like [Pseudophryne corroboree]|uniref:transmembrane protease serine 11D-like n=1 Tax=Pseudophryne corroboree TaxID=495146 RepID=UPI003081ADA4
MAIMAEAVENDGDQQLLQKKSRRMSCGCCASCCSCCIYYLSGFILLLAIAGLVLCARIFLEFPVIINGFTNTMNFTQESVDALMSATQYPGSPTVQPASTEKCKMFVGSFKLLNETYLPQYNDTSSAGFQTATQHLQAMLNKHFNNSLLQANFRKASVFAISPDPVIAYFQLLFCYDSATLTKIEADNVSLVLKSYNASREKANISVDVQSVTVGDLAPCPGFVNAYQAWPWQVILQENQIPLCTGSLLNSFWLLTSADCIKNRDVSLLTVILEAGNPSQSSTSNIAKIIQHPNVTAAPVVNNFALIRLSKPAWFTSSLMPICLSQTTEDPAIGSVCSASTGNMSTGGLLSLVGTVTSGLSCLSVSDSGLLYLQFSLSNDLLKKIGTGNAFVCMNTDNTAYLQGTSLYLSNSSLLSSTCLSYTSTGPAIDWINSSIN